MDTVVGCTIIIIMGMAVYYYYTVTIINKSTKTITAKQDAIMAKLIEIKTR